VSGRPAVPVAARLPLLAGGGLGLLGRLYTALLLLDVPLPDTAAGVGPTHGPVMVFGFVGTLVALERAVALGARWALLAPACSGLGAVTLLAGGQARAGWLLLSVAAVGLLGRVRGAVAPAGQRRAARPERRGVLLVGTLVPCGRRRCIDPPPRSG
jgi:hypothetical protein